MKGDIVFNDISAIILAAGEGTRMKSEFPKVLHKICGRTMLEIILDLVKSLKIDNIIVVIGHKKELLKKKLGRGVVIVYQNRLLGTADAVRRVESRIANLKKDVLILYADNPLLKIKTLSRLIRHHRKTKAACTLLSANLEEPFGYGRIIRDESGSVERIVEQRDTTIRERRIKEANAGVYCFQRKELFKSLKKVRMNSRKREYYLTDTIGILSKSKAKIETVSTSCPEEVLGVNSRQDLIKAEKVMRSRIIEEFISKGITILDPATTYIHQGVRIGYNTVIFPNTFIESEVRVGKNCTLGPFCHLRPGTVIKDATEIGNFVEISRSTIGRYTKVKHFGYLGDARIGERVNIGAGTVTANYDGKKKAVTIIKDKAFIGSDTILVAPIKVGELAITGAGSVVTKNKNVPPNTTVVGVPARPLKKKSNEDVTYGGRVQ